MAVIKGNRKSGKKEVIATSKATNISVDNPEIVEQPTSLDDVIKKHEQDIEELRGNVKWLYKYGGTGSGSGGGGGGTGNAKFEILNAELQVSGADNLIYISDNKIVVRYRIFQSGSSSWIHSVYLGDKLVVDNQTIKSNQEQTITLTNLSQEDTNTIRFSAFDDQGIPIEDYVLKIICGSITITSSTVSNNGSISKYYGTGDIEVSFDIMNRVKGSATILEIRLNNMDDGMIQETFERDGLTSYRLKVMEQLNGGAMLETGVTYTVTAQAFTSLNGQTIPSDVYTFSVSLMDNKSLIITVTDISEESVDDDDLNLKTFSQGSDISFYYNVNAASYSSFRVAFEICDARKNPLATIGSIYPPGQATDPDDHHDLWEDNKQVQKGTNNNFSYSTNKIPSDKIGVIYIRIYAWTSDGSMGSGVGGAENNPIKTVKCKIVATEQTVPAYTNGNNTKWVDLDCPQNFSDYQDKNSVNLVSQVLDDQSQPMQYTCKLTLTDCNNVSSGFIKNELTENNAALRVSGESHANLAINFFNGTNIGSWSLINAGFVISVSFKTDKHPNANGTVFSYGSFDAEGTLISGFEIGLEYAKCAYDDGGKMRTVQTALVQNVTSTVDFVCEKIPSEKVGFVKIYLDGSLTAVEIIENIDRLSFGSLRNGAYLGCKEVNGELTNFCDVNIFNIRIYKKALDIPDLIINYLINYAYLNRTVDNNFDWTKIEQEKAKNFISPEWQCTIWDYYASTPTWKKGTDLYNQISANPVLPVLLLTETASNSTFHDMYNTSYNEANGKVAQEYHTQITMAYRDTAGKVINVRDMTCTLQGTSSMSYAAKNLELYFGTMADGQPRLFSPKEEWLPENQFTLKADVIDSAHANNTSIGEFVNNGYFEEIYPMKFSFNPYAKKVKHTLEGFPVYMFFKFGDNTEPTFLGIYNFNLGRGSNYNMGFKVLENYTYETETAPSLVSSYTEKVDPYNGGVFSFEFNTNSPTDIVAFQQSDRTIVDYIIDQRYPEEGDPSQQAGWNRLYKIFDGFARMYSTTEAPKKWVYQNNVFVETDERLGSQIRPTMEYFPTDTSNTEGYIFWNNANRYFVIAMAFGMLDSLGKNMTLRSWNVDKQGNSGQFTCAFYDMDTALGLDNYGNEEVPETTYIDWWYNEIVNGYTVAKRLENQVPSGQKGYDMPCSRLWEIVRNMIRYDPGNVELNYQSYWSELRKDGGLLSSVDNFLDNYYLAHTKDVGAIIYNMDYSVKYLKKYEMENADGSKTEGYNDLKFLHGTRKNYVRSWLSKRLKYIDSCMNIAGLYELDQENNQWVTAYPQSVFKDSPYVERWSGRGNGSDNPTFTFEVLSDISILFAMTIATNTQRILLSANKPTTFRFKGTNSSSTMSWNVTNNLSEFKGFDQLNFASIGIFTMKGLLNLDFSNMRSFDNTTQSNFNISGLTELRTLNLEGTKAVNPASGFVIDVSKCLKLKSLNIRNSDVGSLVLPGNTEDSIGAGVLSELLVTGSLLSSLTLQNQQFIKDLDFTDCSRLTSVNLSTLKNLETITFNRNPQLQSVIISNCPKLRSIICNYNSNLVEFTIDTCTELKTINLDNCDNQNLTVNINGAFNLEHLHMAYVTTKNNVIIPSYETELSNVNFYNTLKTLNLYSSQIKGFDFGTVGNTSTYNDQQVLDLSHFTALENWNDSEETGLCLVNNTAVEYIKFDNNSKTPYAVGKVTQLIGTTNQSVGFFYGCTNLKRVFGHLKLDSTSIFTNCSNFYIREPLEKIGGKTPIPDGNFKGNNTSIEDEKQKWWKDENLDTNFTLTSNCSSMFNGTAVTLSDVYYIFRIASNVTNFSNCFSSCPNIVTTVEDSFSRDTFKYCGKVTSLNSCFSSCAGIAGILYSVSHNDDGTVTAYDGLFTPLKSITDMNSMFWNDNIEWIDDMLFWKRSASDTDCLGLTSLNSFIYDEKKFKTAKNTTAKTMTEGSLRATKLLRYLPNITSIQYFLCRGGVVLFDTVTEMIDDVSVEYCPLFMHNTKLTSLYYFMVNVKASGSLINMFGGQQELLTKYPTKFPAKMARIRTSFNIGTANGSKVQFEIRNDMFERCKNSLTNIGTETLNATNSSCFTGQINKTYKPENNNGEIFPYYVFSSCVNLQECAGFFRGLNYVNDQVLDLPTEDMFSKCTKLSNISYLFYGMTNTKFRMKGNGFKNCQLKNVAYCFAGNTNNMIGQIPQRLFYMEYKTSRTTKGWENNNAEGIDENYGIKDGKYNPSVAAPTPKNIKTEYYKIRKSIIDMSYAIYGMQSTEARPYTLSLSGLTGIEDSSNILMYNENYETCKYILNNRFNADTEPEEIDNPNYNPDDPLSPSKIPNPNYDPHLVIVNPNYDNAYRIWDEYCTDGSNIRDIVLGSKLYTAVPSLPRELPSSFYDENNNHNSTTATGKYMTMNYVCPPDLFLYCENSSSVKVDYCLANSNKKGSPGDENYGLSGRIPPILFVPISKAQNLIGVFYNLIYIVPYSWSYYNEGGTLIYGSIYPPTLLQALGTNLRNIKELFGGTTMHSKCIVPEDFLSKNTQLQNLEGLWGRSTSWKDTTMLQLPIGLFSQCKNIQNVSDLLGNGTSVASSNWAMGPYKVDKSWFTESNHKNISNIAYFMNRCINASGTIPEFWKFAQISSPNNRTAAFNYLSRSRITNLEDAKNSKYGDMVTNMQN